MKIIVQIGSAAVLLSPEQLDMLTTMLDGCEVLNNKYIGGSHGSNYIELIQELEVRRALDIRCMPTMQYDGLKLITKLHLEAEKK